MLLSPHKEGVVLLTNLGFIITQLITLYLIRHSPKYQDNTPKNFTFDKTILYLSIISEIILFFALFYQSQYSIHMIHNLFSLFVFILIPLFAQSKALLTLHVATILVTLGLRSQYNGCLLSMAEGPVQKLFISPLAPYANACLVLAAIVSLIRIYLYQNPNTQSKHPIQIPPYYLSTN